MSIHTHAPMTFRRILLVSISACVACSIISWCASKWVYDKPIGMMYSSNPYVVGAVTAMVISANLYLIKKLVLEPSTPTARSSDACTGYRRISK